MKSSSWIVAYATAGLLAIPGSGLAESNRMHELMTRARAEALASRAGVVTSASSPNSPDYGTADLISVNIGAYAFQGANSLGDQLSDDGNGYRFLAATTSGGYIAAPVTIPTGVTIEHLTINLCSSPSGDLTVALFDAGWLGQPISLISSLTTVPNGCYWQNQSLSYDYDTIVEHPLYVVIHWEGPMDGSLKFNNVSVYYRLRVSPAPATATFNDVPTDHPFFQYIEALAASGITSGCGNGNFCPNQPVTRGQVAVFLSKALGLHWQQ